MPKFTVRLHLHEGEATSTIRDVTALDTVEALFTVLALPSVQEERKLAQSSTHFSATVTLQRE